MIPTAKLVATKDLRIEWRSRVLIWQVVPFAVMALVLAGLAVGPSPQALRRVAPGAFYLVLLLASLLAVGRSRSGAGGRAAGDGRARTDEGRAARRYSFAVVTPQAVEAIWGRSRRYAALRATGSGARGRYGLSRCWVSWRARIASSLALASPRSPLAVRRGGPGTVRAAAGTPRPSRPSRPASPAGTGPGTPVRRR